MHLLLHYRNIILLEMLFIIQDLGNSNNEFSEESYTVLLCVLTF